MSKQDVIESWIESVTRENASLGVSQCPYAKHSKYRIVECDAKEISVFAPGHDQYDVVVYIVEDKFIRLP